MFDQHLEMLYIAFVTTPSGLFRGVSKTVDHKAYTCSLQSKENLLMDLEDPLMSQSYDLPAEQSIYMNSFLRASVAL